MPPLIPALVDFPDFPATFFTAPFRHIFAWHAPVKLSCQWIPYISPQIADHWRQNDYILYSQNNTYVKKGLHYSACNLIWRAVSGFQDVMKQREIGRNKEENDKEIEKEEAQNATKPTRFCGAFCWLLMTIKLGFFFRFWPFLCPPIEVTATTVINSHSALKEKL